MTQIGFIRYALLFFPAALLAPILPLVSPVSQPQEFHFRPEDEGRREIWISKESENLIWRLRIPERMFSDEGVLVGHDIRAVHTPVVWKQEGDAWVYHRANNMDTAAQTTRYPIEYTIRLAPGGNGVDLRMTVKNLGETTLHNVVGHICLGHRSEPFRDPNYERTFIRSGNSFLNLKETGRGPDPIRARYGVKGRPSIKFFDSTNNPFWGPLSPQKADNGLILTRSKQGDQLVALWFEPAAEVFQNSDERNMCIHSDPTFGDLAPDESVTVEGRIIHFRGDLTSFEKHSVGSSARISHTLSTAAADMAVSTALRSVRHPRRTVQYVCGVFGRAP